jgi:hypothetical protein
MLEETHRQVIAIIDAFRTQVAACTDAESRCSCNRRAIVYEAWNRACVALGTGDTFNMAAAEPKLVRGRDRLRPTR